MTSIAYSWWIFLQNGSGKTSPREPRCSKWLHRRRLEFWSPANGTTDTSIKTGVFRAKKLGNTRSKSRSRKDYVSVFCSVNRLRLDLQVKHDQTATCNTLPSLPQFILHFFDPFKKQQESSRPCEGLQFPRPLRAGGLWWIS